MHQPKINLTATEIEQHEKRAYEIIDAEPAEVLYAIADIIGVTEQYAGARKNTSLQSAAYREWASSWERPVTSKK